MNVLVTGAAGLYGVHLIDELVKDSKVERVIGIDDFSRDFLVKDPFIHSEGFENKFTLINKRFQELTLEEIDGMSLDAVIHLAAFISIPESMEKQDAYFENNEYGTFKLMQTLLKTKNHPLMVYASSPEVYGTAVYVPMDINHPMLPKSTYAVTKLAAEKHCMAMHEWYKYPVVVIRNFNTFGENQDHSDFGGVVSIFINKALKNEDIIIHNDGSQTRDFQYVKDAVSAYALVVKRGNELAGEVFNIGTGRQTTIKDLACKIKEISGSKSNIIFNPGRSADLMSLEADYSGITKKVGWTPRYTLEQGLERTINWFKSNIR